MRLIDAGLSCRGVEVERLAIVINPDKGLFDEEETKPEDLPSWRVECEFRIQTVSRYDFDPAEFRDLSLGEVFREIVAQLPWVEDSEDLMAAALKVYCAAAAL